MLTLMSQVACRPTSVGRGAGAAAAVGSKRTLLDFFKPKSATDGAKESPVSMNSSSEGGARGDADVVATGVVSRGEGGEGAGSDADVVVTGVASKGEGGAGAGRFAYVVATGAANGLEDCEGAGIDMDGVFSDDADGSGPADRTIVHAPINCAGLRPAVREPVFQYYPSTIHGIGNQGVSWEARINLNRVSLHAVSTASRGILNPGCAGTVEQPGGRCAPCLDIKGTKADRVLFPSAALCPQLIFSDYIDHLALTQGFTYLNNLKYSLTPLALAKLASLPRLFVNARVCSKTSSGAQSRNEPPIKETK